MRSPTTPAIPTHTLFRAPGERVRLVTVRHHDTLLDQRKSWLLPHRKDYYLLLLLTSGSGRYWLDTVPHEFRADSLFFSTPTQVHAKEEVQTAGTAICLTPDFFTQAANADLRQLPFLQYPHLSHGLRLAPNDLTELRQLCQRIVQEYEQPADLHDELLYAYLRVLLLTIGRLCYQQPSRAAAGPTVPSLYHRLQASIEHHYKTLRDVPAYAQLLHLSANHLNTIIKEQSGKTVLQLLHERQLLEAKRLLYHTERSVKEIAFELGFQDAAYFTRFFKRLAGVTPLHYRTGSE
ncbi:helix-turn-helix domain-containing protein (plasmid) [Hymenobacter sp. NBH84]|uniref:helix-turn-helix domain-containing protein n=1 Tax=Hymenobacter sp. NBH84 TaxID=2596915 RepID=UPI00162A5D3B|nr:helix-turn-helix domain-containing protein [Hymenobacter sp. NBH84]QNE41972.1 helix-turn-helix domain-containing protein [Hymenobacter sp. NBH84]